MPSRFIYNNNTRCFTCSRSRCTRICHGCNIVPYCSDTCARSDWNDWHYQICPYLKTFPKESTDFCSWISNNPNIDAIILVLYIIPQIDPSDINGLQFKQAINDPSVIESLNNIDTEITDSLLESQQIGSVISNLKDKVKKVINRIKGKKNAPATKTGYAAEISEKQAKEIDEEKESLDNDGF